MAVERAVAETGARRAGTRIRVFLADDHAVLRQGVRMLLESEGDLEVVGEAASGEEAVSEIVRLRPDVAVVDISLPGKNGIQATQEIHRAAPDVRILILTMHDRQDYVVEALEAGASGYVVKESAVDQLVRAVRGVARGDCVLSPDRAGDVLERVVNAGSGAARKAPGTRLTRREDEILRLIAQGLHNAEIAERLAVSLKTVQTHRSHIMEKLNVHDRVELVKYAVRHGLVDL